jgi:hypothetical protein
MWMGDNMIGFHRKHSYTPEQVKKNDERERRARVIEAGEPRLFARKVYNLLMDGKNPQLMACKGTEKRVVWKTISYLDEQDGRKAVTIPFIHVPESDLPGLKFIMTRIAVEEANKKAQEKGKEKPGWFGRLELKIDIDQIKHFSEVMKDD